MSNQETPLESEIDEWESFLFQAFLFDILFHLNNDDKSKKPVYNPDKVRNEITDYLLSRRVNLAEINYYHSVGRAYAEYRSRYPHLARFQKWPPSAIDVQKTLQIKRKKQKS